MRIRFVILCANIWLLVACQSGLADRPEFSVGGKGDGNQPPPPPPTAQPGATGLPAARLLWEWEEDARPSALATGAGRLGVIVSDGRFLWLDAATGKSIAGGFIWIDDIRGETSGDVIIQGDIAIVSAFETYQRELEDFPITRARMVAFGADGKELWSLPELGDKHLYSVAMGPDTAFVGTHRGFEGNQLAAYALATGEIRWRYSADDYGFETLVADENRIYSALVNVGGGGIGAYDLQTGALLWAEYGEDIRLADHLLLADGRLYVLTQPAAVALSPQDGQQQWAANVGLAPEAGMVADGTFLYVVPAPTAGLGNRPGLLGIDTTSGEVAWHALAGLIADPLAASGEALWAVVKDVDSQVVYLSVLEATTGLERARLYLGQNVETHFKLLADGDVSYVLDESLRAYVIPRE